MLMLQILFALTVLALINCFQVAAAILAKQLKKDSRFWFWVSLVLPGISLIILICLWSNKKNDI